MNSAPDPAGWFRLWTLTADLCSAMVVCAADVVDLSPALDLGDARDGDVDWTSAVDVGSGAC